MHISNTGLFQAITNIYGKDHVLLGITKNFKITDTNEKVMDIGTMLSGYTIRVSHGTSTESEISVNLDLVDFKLVSKKQPGVVVELDKERPGLCKLLLRLEFQP